MRTSYHGKKGTAEFSRQGNSKCSDPVAVGGMDLIHSPQTVQGWDPEDKRRHGTGSGAQKEVLARGVKLMWIERITEAQLCLQNTAEKQPIVKGC